MDCHTCQSSYGSPLTKIVPGTGGDVATRGEPRPRSAEAGRGAEGDGVAPGWDPPPNLPVVRLRPVHGDRAGHGRIRDDAQPPIRLVDPRDLRRLTRHEVDREDRKS